MEYKSYKYRFYPTCKQKELLAKTFGCVRFVYNHILKWRTDAYYERKEKIGYLAAHKQLTLIKKLDEYKWLNDASAVALQQTLRHQEIAFKNFFNHKARYPTFKKKSHRQSATFGRNSFRFKSGNLYMAKNNDPLLLKVTREIPSYPLHITITKDFSGRYFVSCLCEFKPIALPIINKQIGIDLGIENLLITSDGEKTKNKHFTQQYASKLAKAERNLSRKKLGSANRTKAKLKVAKIHAKIADSRIDNLHKISRKLINENQVICAETLRIKNMIRNHRLSKHIADASWSELCRQLTYKAKWAGRTFVQIDQWFPSSKRCHCCGFIVDTLPLNIRSWLCPKCMASHDRDINAAKNVLAAGLAVLAFGESVSLASLDASSSQ